MHKVNRIFLAITALLAAWQVAIGIDGLERIPVLAYTTGFGVLMVACLLLIILGLEILNSPIVVIISTILPLSLSLGLIWEYLPEMRVPYLVFSILGFLAVLLTRTLPIKNRLPTIILAIVHGVAGMIIFLLPPIWAARGLTHAGFAFAGLGGALIGLGGLLLSFLKGGKPILPKETILNILPSLLLLMTIAYVSGFALR